MHWLGTIPLHSFDKTYSTTKRPEEVKEKAGEDETIGPTSDVA